MKAAITTKAGNPETIEIEKGNINLNIDKTYSLNEVALAHQYMEDNKAKGKIVVVV